MSILLQSQYSTSSANQRSMFSSYRNKSTDLQSKLIDWFLYDRKNWLLMAQYITDLLCIVITHSIFAEAFLEPSRTSTMELLCENS